MNGGAKAGGAEVVACTGLRALGAFADQDRPRTELVASNPLPFRYWGHLTERHRITIDLDLHPRHHAHVEDGQRGAFADGLLLTHGTGWSVNFFEIFRDDGRGPGWSVAPFWDDGWHGGGVRVDWWGA